MYIHKFGGASIKDAERIENVAKIIKENLDKSCLIVVSAMGKTTNAMEQIVQLYVDNKTAQAFEVLGAIKRSHYEVCDKILSPELSSHIKTELNDIFVEIEWMIEVPSEDPYNYIYDQIVSVGELASSRILQAVIHQLGIDSEWIDARGLIKTDNKHRNASVDWEQSKNLIQKECKPKLEAGKMLVTQGFIGCTSENFTTTLGREGSDFSAAIFASCLSANSMTVWKDVPGVMNADPAINEQAQLLSKLSYSEALAMTYYGAKVIHPKTIKPMQVDGIPLFVKSFLVPKDPGTEISSLEQEESYPPIIIVDDNNIFLEMSSKDNTFVREAKLAVIFRLMEKHGLVLKLDRNTPNSFIACIGDPYSNIEKFVKEAEDVFNVSIQTEIDLLTIRHRDEASAFAQLNGKDIIFKEAAEHTVQYVLK